MKTLMDFIDLAARLSLGVSIAPDLLAVEASVEKAFEQAMVDANAKYLGKRVVSTADALVDLMTVDAAVEIVLHYRLQRQLFLTDEGSRLLGLLASVARRRTGCEIYYSTDIGPGLNIQHGFGIVVGPRHQIGAGFTIHQNVTLGQRRLGAASERIIIGDRVTLFAGASILGSVRIGDDAAIAAHAVVLTDVERGAVYGGVPARRLK